MALFFNGKKKIGVLGGRSEIGKYCLQELLKSTPGHAIISGGRSLPEEQEKLNNVEYFKLDIFNKEELDIFCKECTIIINCAGPSTVILGLVADACIQNNVHYIDVGGYDILFDLLKKKESEIKEKGLVFVISAGWMPGISGLLPIYMSNNAERLGIQINSVNIYTTGKEKWSYGSCRDMVWSVFEDFSGIYEYGVWGKRNMWFDTKKVKFHSINQAEKVMVMFNNQLKDFAISRKYPIFSTYMGANEFGFRAKALIMYIKFFMRNRREKAAAYFYRTIEKEVARKKRFGLLKVEVLGAKGEKIDAELYTENNFLLTGITPAIIVTQLLENKIEKKGVRYMCECSNAEHFFQRLVEYNHKIQYSYV